ncbi:autotransporter-associated N-terminal domain-containing protein, partial [Fusobacterium animalis]|uniref:autotransporter-associated N-terminal domain-containing protein n=1 Tax=Fusobacterium animalis TaxID=76859 RepID=UPI0034DF020C
KEIMSNEQIAESKENLKGSIGNLQSKIDSARAENEKGLTGLKLELIQLMEQGDQVVKSPWASWQFGANYIYNDWRG